MADDEARRRTAATVACVVALAWMCCVAAADNYTVEVVACESEHAHLVCENETTIRVLRATYGRTDSDKCNPGALNFTTECSTPSANDTVATNCSGLVSCDVEASNNVFGDPCPGIEKYLELEYECILPEEDTTSTTVTTVVPPSTSSPMTTTPTDSGPAASLLYCNTHDLRQLDLATKKDTVLATGLNRSVVVDYDFKRAVLYWTDSKEKSIFSCPFAGCTTSSRTLVASNVTSYGIAVDWVHGNLYWTDTGNDVISVATADGKYKRDLFLSLMDEPRGIVLQPSEGWLYWSDWGEVPKIEKAGMDGTQRRVIVRQGLKWPNGLALDLDSRRLFWIEAFHENLCSSDLEGKDIKKVIASSPSLKLPFSMDIYQDYVYWTEWTSNRENVFAAHKITGYNLTKVLDGETTLMGIKVYHPSKQPLTPGFCGDNNGRCGYLCLPSPHGNYSCACPDRMKLHADGLNCTHTDDPSVSLLYCNRADIRRYDLATRRDSQLLSGLQRATVLDYHAAKGTVFWTDTDNKKIYRANILKGSSSPVVLVSSCTSYGLAVDWLHGHVYWTDTHNDRIDVATLEGDKRKTLFTTELDEPRAIVLNPAEGFMFWTDWGSIPKIERSNMDGSHRRVVISQDIRWPNGLALDMESRQIYWVDGKLNYLSVSDFVGSNRRNLISSASVMRHPFSLDVHGAYLYWVEWSSGKESVYRASKEDGRGVQKVFDGERSLMGVKVFDPDRQAPGEGACGDDNGGCSHMCLPTAGPNGTLAASCACPNGLYLDAEKINCSSTPSTSSDAFSIENATNGDQPLLFLANVDDVRVLDLSTLLDYQIIGDLTRSVAVDYIYANRTLLWTDIREDRICSAPLRSGTVARELVSDCLHPDGLAADWVHGHLYWTDKGRDAIGVVRMDGTMEKTLFDSDLDEPRAIALDPFEGWMFWSDWGRVPKIERAGLDGSDRKAIVSRLIQWPNGVTVDLESRRIYWADAKTHEICRAKYDGTDRTTVLSSYTLLKQPFSIDVFREYVYWVEWRSGEESVYRANKIGGGNASKIADGRKWKNLMTIKVYHKDKQPEGLNRCGSDNGGCSHLCLPSPRRDDAANTYKCACPNSLQLAFNGKDCLQEMESTTRFVPTEDDDTYTGAEPAYLLYANKRDVRKLDLGTKTDSLIRDGYMRASGIDFHFSKASVFWTDFETGKIYSAPMSTGRPVRELITTECSSNGLAVDWINDLVFWTDNRRHTVSVCQLDGQNRKTLVTGGVTNEPRTIVLDPGRGYLFWADWGGTPSIRRAGLDGSDVKNIVETGVDWTHALAIDLGERRLLWADGDEKKIFSVDYNGEMKRTVLSAPDLLHLPFSMDLFQENVYWTEFMPLAENIFKANKKTGANPTKVVTRRWPNLMSIKIYHSSKQPRYTVSFTRCRTAGCSHLCLPSPQSFSGNRSPCACPDGMLLSILGRRCIGGETESTTSTSYLVTGYNSSESSIFEIEDNKSGLIAKEGKAPVGVIIGVITALSLIALAGALAFYHRHYLRRNLGNLVFRNPVYTKHREDDFAIETSDDPRTTARKSLVPLTAEEL